MHVHSFLEEVKNKICSATMDSTVLHILLLFGHLWKNNNRFEKNLGSNKTTKVNWDQNTYINCEISIRLRYKAQCGRGPWHSNEMLGC